MSEDHAGEDGFPGLGWPIKASFARYVASLPDGRGALDGAIMASPIHGLIFALADASGYDMATHNGVLKFGGRIGFRGHFGMLNVDVAEPWLEIDTGGGILSIAGSGAGGRIELARCTLSWADAAMLEARSRTLALTAQGSALFGGTYGEGSELDPFTLRLTA